MPANNTNAVYGLFGSIGGVDTARTVVKNLEITGSVINLPRTDTTLGTGTAILSIGSVSGVMFRNSTISNVIVRNSTISGLGTITKSDATSSFYVGGIVGSALSRSSNIDEDPGGALRYAIENCFSNVNISVKSTPSNANATLFNIGGIVGHIRRQPVWPISCLYTGTITASNAVIGPIFGVVRAAATGTTDANRNDIWVGTNATPVPTINNMYYTGYTVNGRTFTSDELSGAPAASTVSRINATASNIGYTQGVNKGQYTNDMNARLSMFNTYATTNNTRVGWEYSNGTFKLVERLTTTIEEDPAGTYNVEVLDNYNINNYTSVWYVDGVNTITADTYSTSALYNDDIEIEVVTDDTYYYTVSKFTIPKLAVQIRFNIDTINHSVAATVTGEGVNPEDYTYQWYQTDLSGLGAMIPGATGLSLDGLCDGTQYRLVATNHVDSGLSADDNFTYGGGTRTVVYVSSAAARRVSNWK